jgi:hypothetical protein
VRKRLQAEFHVFPFHGSLPAMAGRNSKAIIQGMRVASLLGSRLAMPHEAASSRL